ncbi:MAG: adenylyl-sulfate kinase [Planctomycetes bacterium]|nr:adenylyl-sulfate kinase [Planctomycetota bacterium]
MHSPAFILWFTGLSGAGKSTIAAELARELTRRGLDFEVLDGDVVRENLSKGLGFGKADRDINVRRIGWVAGTLAKHGCIAIGAAISPYRAVRDEIRAQYPRFVEVHLKVPVEVCEARDVKGLYKKARAGELTGFTGVDDPYEEPLHPEVVCETHQETVAQSAAKILHACERLGYLSPGASPVADGASGAAR